MPLRGQCCGCRGVFIWQPCAVKDRRSRAIFAARRAFGGEVEVYERKEEKLGQYAFQSADANDELEILRGRTSPTRDGLMPGADAPGVQAFSLDDGTSIVWRPSKDRRTLVVFSPLPAHAFPVSADGNVITVPEPMKLP